MDEDTSEVYYGCNQKWYTTLWQRLAGCGPTVASNLIFYLYNARNTTELGESFTSKKKCLSLMEEVWEYVTPAFQGVSTTKMFYEGLLSYTKSKKLDFEYRFMDVPKDKLSRPELSVTLKFLEEALLEDAPIAFLNLCNGAEKNLDQWHWVTIVSLEYVENWDQAFVNVLDDGEIKKIDLAIWYNTTTKGGGFVYFKAPSLTEFDKDRLLAT